MRSAFLLLCGLMISLSCADGDIADHLKSRLPTSIITAYGNNNDGSWYPDTLNNVISDTTLAVGENLLNSTETQLSYGYMIFDLSSFGLTADSIASVSLNIYKSGTQGTPTSLGVLYVDHVTSVNTVTTPPVEDNFCAFAVPSDMTWTVIDVTGQVKNDLTAGRSTTSYMIGFSGYVSNSQYDIAYFDSYESSNQPYLTIVYWPEL